MSSDFDINAHLFRIQNMGSGGGDGGGGGGGIDGLIVGGLNQTIDNVLTRILGMPINPSLEGKGIFNQYDLQKMGENLSLTVATPIRDLPGGILARILTYFTRELPAGLDGGIEPVASADMGAGFGGDMGGGGDGGGAGGGSDTGASTGAGGGDYYSEMPSYAGSGADAVAVSYGDKMVFTDAPEGDLGQLSPPSTGGGMANRGEGMEI